MKRRIAPLLIATLALAACVDGSRTRPATPSAVASTADAPIQTMSMLDQLGRVASAQTAEASQPRLRGDLLGIAFAPTMAELPPDAQEEHARLAASGGCTAIPIEQAAALALPRPLALPGGFAVKDGFPQATACGGQPSGLNWDAITSSGGDISIVRSIQRYDTTDALASRVSVRDIGGRQAVLVSPVTPDGVAQRSAVYFPEPFGITAIYAFNLPVDDLLTVARAVAEATR